MPSNLKELSASATIPEKTQGILTRLIAQNGLSHALLLSSSLGYDLRNVALFLAESLLCSDSSETACGHCIPCKQITSGQFVDLLEISEEKALPIERIRRLHEDVKHGPSVASRLIVIIHDVEQMSVQAANAFLKLLEEPAESVHFLLLSHKPMTLLPTILSRCQHLRIPSMGEKTLISEEAKERYMSFSEFQRLSVTEAFQLALTWSKDKAELELFLSQWLQEIFLALADEGNSEARDQLLEFSEKIVEKISHLKYNLNLRLHLEVLFLKELYSHGQTRKTAR